MARHAHFRGRLTPWLLLAPQLGVTLVFFYWPALQALYQSALQQDAFGTRVEYVGLENFQRLLADPAYLASFRVTMVFAVLVACGGLTLALLLAACADRVVRAAAVYRTLLIWPYAVAPAIAGVLWLFMFSPSLGVVAHAIGRLGIAWNPLLDADHALALVVMAATWKQISYNFVFFFAGLQAIPRSLLEAAAIDGARPLRRFATIAVPLLAPTTFFLLVINVVYAFFDTFAIIDAATQGGPGQETSTLVYKVYQDGFKALDLGSSAAQSVILMAIVIALTALQFRFVERRIGY